LFSAQQPSSSPALNPDVFSFLIQREVRVLILASLTPFLPLFRSLLHSSHSSSSNTPSMLLPQGLCPCRSLSLECSSQRYPQGCLPHLQGSTPRSSDQRGLLQTAHTHGPHALSVTLLPCLHSI
jgi:hypothetical protein